MTNLEGKAAFITSLGASGCHSKLFGCSFCCAHGLRGAGQNQDNQPANLHIGIDLECPESYYHAINRGEPLTVGRGAPTREELKQQKASMRQLSQSFQAVLPNLTETEKESYQERARILGETAAMRWVVEKQGTGAPGQGRP